MIFRNTFTYWFMHLSWERLVGYCSKNSLWPKKVTAVTFYDYADENNLKVIDFHFPLGRTAPEYFITSLAKPEYKNDGAQQETEEM